MMVKLAINYNRLRRIIVHQRRVLIGTFTLFLVLLYFFVPRWYNEYELLKFYNLVGQRGGDMASFHYWLNRETSSFRRKILATLDDDDADSTLHGELRPFPRETEEMSTGVGQLNLALVSCGDRREEALAMIRSALLMSRDAKLNVIAFADFSSMQEFAAAILKLKWEANRAGMDFRYELKKTWFPESGPWKGMFRPCATQRLFLPRLLPAYDSILYVDTDALFLSNVTEYWDYFTKMDSKQFSTMVANDEMPGNGWYNLHSRIPHFGPRGLNAGIMLMNLTRMRDFGFEDKCLNIYEEFRDNIALADQDILNILFYQHPELLLEISCAYNFRTSHCDCEHDDYAGRNCKCKAAMENGVRLVHGNQESFHKNAYPFYRNMFKAFSELRVDVTSVPALIEKLKDEYEEENRAINPCFDLTVEMLYGRLESYLSKKPSKQLQT